MMRRCAAIYSAWLLGALISFGAPETGETAPADVDGPKIFQARGVVMAVQPRSQTMLIRHEAIPHFMDAMTMPFKVKATNGLAGWKRGDQVTFQLHLDADESWVDGLVKIGNVVLPPETPNKSTPAALENARPAFFDYHFTNELGETVTLNDFHGQALAITFFYTRCPLPDYCPRLSRNFQAASEKLAAMPNAPTNWHFLSISFDPQFDSPAMLKAYGASYRYDPAHWSFLAGSPQNIAGLARECGVTYESDGATINHNFRTLIVDPAGRLQMVFMMGGDLSDAIVTEMLKAAAPGGSSGRSQEAKIRKP